MVNHFKSALNDSNFMNKLEGKHIHKAVLHAFSRYRDQGKSIYDLPWFALAKHKKEQDKKLAA